jgi:hypothetical protein
MNRERAETYLRLLAEVEMRKVLSPRTPRAADAPATMFPVKVIRVAWTLTAVDALDRGTAKNVLADIQLALTARGLAEPGATTRVYSGSYFRAVARPLARGAGSASTGTPDRHVPVGRVLPFHTDMVIGELGLMSFSHTDHGARFTASSRIRNLLGPSPAEWPFNQFIARDDRGHRYRLDFEMVGPPEWVCYPSLRPEPPRDIRWLDVTAPGEAAVRISLERDAPRTPDGAGPQVRETGLSAGEHLLNQIAARLLATGPLDLAPGAVSDLAPVLGETVAALEAAEALSPLSPVPGRLVALCAGLSVSGHGITAPRARKLPEPWFSLLAYWLLRNPDTVPAHDGFAAVTTVLPELDGIRLVLLGVHNGDGNSWLHAHAAGRLPDEQYGPFGLDASFPLSFWIRDSGRRWHVAPPAYWFPDSGSHHLLGGRRPGGAGERTLLLRLVPPLARSTPWIEVLVSGRSAEVQARLPLHWEASHDR